MPTLPARRPPVTLAALFLAALLGACGSLPRNAVPVELIDKAVLPGLPDVRAPAGQRSAVMERDLELSFAQESPTDFPRGPDGRVDYAHLALSGGGANGAFGAGFLNGWTATGKRPLFKIVTGVSTGALMAPFAFLGPDHDDALRTFYTTTRTRDILTVGSFTDIVTQLLFGEAIANSAPLAALIERYVDDRLLAAVADAHRRGRRLYVATTDLDGQRFMIWNMGLIATSGHPSALAVFRQAMLASASIPVAFPPVLFDVEAAGERYDELHVDGGVAANVFYSGGLFSPDTLRRRGGRGGGRETLFIIHNGQFGPRARTTPRSLPGIALRTLESAGKAAFIGDLFRIYSVTQTEDAAFNWVTIPESVDLSRSEIFDPVAMGALYEAGLRSARAGPVWRTSPPGLAEGIAP